MRAASCDVNKLLTREQALPMLVKKNRRKKSVAFTSIDEEDRARGKQRETLSPNVMQRN